MNAGPTAREVVEHHLRLLGLPRDAPALVAEPGHALESILQHAEAGVAVAALEPSPGLCEGLGVTSEDGQSTPTELHYDARVPWARLRTLHPHRVYRGARGEPVVIGPRGVAAWLWLPVGPGGVLLVGTDLAGDLVRYRQGDPARAERRDAGPLWGISGERPIYLYEEQIEADRPHERYADAWARALAHVLAARAGVALQPVLPGGAPGAIVVTGDDDQASLETYDAQLKLLGDLPVTYFLHPMTKHSPASLRRLEARPRTELALHPDALDAPESYGELLADQVRWFERLTGRRPRTLRNHGYLNDGYWGHLGSWLREGLEANANLPGVDGRVLNGSLLPARMAADGTLTSHWSILTAIGDGVVFGLGMDEEASARCVHEAAERIRASGLPGVLVLNLHPENVERTASMHRAAREVADAGFLAWTIGECIDWFQARDRSPHGELVSL